MKNRLTFLALLVLTSTLQARVVEYDITVAEQRLAPAGKTVRALTLNGGIPGPVLRFREGDVARIRIHNTLKREDTSVHWHGLLLPNLQDGVPYLTTPTIKPGTTHTFEFPLRHSGTYWYHSHTGMQKQIGTYGAVVVEPRNGEPQRADREHVVVLSDWTNENPKEVMRSLMRGSEYYAIRKGSMPSILGAAQAGTLRQYFKREKARLPAMDISDVAYDAFLINGQRRSTLESHPGETVRLRVVNASASTYFYLQSATGPQTIVAADGPPVKPIQVNRLFIGMGETYDVFITVPRSGAWEFRATAQDGSGHASLFLGEGEEHLAPDVPRPDNYRMDETLLAAITDAEEASELDDKAALAAESPRPLSPYRRLKALHSTTVRGTLPTRKITLRLTGDMERYIWSINGKTLAEESTIPVKHGEVLQMEFINDTMMHHPMHLHGHFFRVLEDQGSRAPLKHTVDVPPMGRRTIEFLANEEHDWFLHCHLLYHMDAGMARVLSYKEGGKKNVNLGPKTLNPSSLMVDGMLLNNMSMGMASVMNQRNNFTLSWDVGWGHGGQRLPHKHEDGGFGLGYEVDLVWQRYFNPNFSAFAGFRWTNEELVENRAIAGVLYRLPYLVNTQLTVDSEGGIRLGIGKVFQLTDRFGVAIDAEYDTRTQFEWSVGANYVLTKNFSLIGLYHSAHGLGAGFGFSF